MKLYSILFGLGILLLVSCKTDGSNQVSEEEGNDTSAAFEKMLDNYYEEDLKLNPLKATMAGDNRYNNSFPNSLSDEHQSALKAYFSKYLEEAKAFKNEDLTDSEQLSKAILIWECEINLARLTYREDLRPIDQMWSVNLMVGQLASGASAQPFKTVEDYNNWLERLDGYLEWMTTAEEKMRAGIELGYVLPKSLIKKVLPQLEALTVENLDQHLFYSPIKDFPDPYQYFGMLGAEMHRAIRLVVDTGIHSKGWSREKAIEYSLENEAESEASIISEIERYMANPGQALSYKIGQLKIRELRNRSQEALGEAFDIRKFHNQVLETGCVPLALLEHKIDNWIAASQ